MKRVPLYPLAIAMWLTLLAWSLGVAGESRWIDLGTSLIAALLTASVGLVVASLLTTNRDRLGLLAVIVVFWSALFSDFMGATPRAWRLSEGEGALLWSAVALVLIMVVRRLSPPPVLTRVVSTASVILLVFQVVPIGATVMRGESLTETHARRRLSARDAARPDIYVIVLDKYTSTPWLARRYGFDNRPFEDSLRQLSFFVPTRARSNYPHTGLVLATLFNGRPIHEIISAPRSSWSEIFEQLRGARFWSELQARGYRFAFYPTTFNATSRMPSADIVLEPTTDAPRRATGAFATWGLRAPLAALHSLRCGLRGCRTTAATSGQRFAYPLDPASAIRWKLASIATLPDSAGPLVAFLHVLAPHEPYQFNADCSDREPWWPQSDEGISAEVSEAYIAQVQCVNAMVLEAVSGILQRSVRPPIIIVQSDHGHGQITRDALRGQTLAFDELSTEALRERLDVFAAYYAPGVAAEWYDSISPANVLPIVMNGTFGTTWPRSPDRSWWVDNFSVPLALRELRADQLRLSTDALPSP
jgi:hypothetical protein